ncbi:MAG: hypothetical protein KBE54_04875, partial [Bilophila sp.]|nr:hypothetical protein [Bilophila sp.]
TYAIVQLFQTSRPAADPHENFRGIGVGFGEGKGELFQRARFPLPNISLFQKFSNKNFLPLSMVSHVNILL